MKPRVVLGLGSNCGDRLEYFRRAIRALSAREVASKIHLKAVSPVYESDAMLPPHVPESEKDLWNQPFLNLAVLIESEMAPLALLAEVKRIEKELGRQQRPRWAPREIDIDILAVEGTVLRSEPLMIPHAGLRERPFAVFPFADLAPEWVFAADSWPGSSGLSMREIADKWRLEAAAGTVPYQTRRSKLILPELMGIVNVTPDSFSDGGNFLDPQAALKKAESLVISGATVLDVGAESTRPGAVPLDSETEWRRLEPVLSLLGQSEVIRRSHAKISLDTRHAWTAERALRHGVHWLNDVTGAENPKMREVLSACSSPVVVMHSLGVPASPSTVLPEDTDPVDFLIEWGEERIEELEECGITRSRIIFDPGIGFGKTPDQSLYIMKNVERFHVLGLPILIGHSRKSFMKKWLDLPPSERDLETAGVSQYLAERGVDYLRVHDIETNLRVLQAGFLMNGVIRR